MLLRPDGTVFKAQSEDLEFDAPPARGDVVTFAYDNVIRASVPVNPIVVRVRNDMSWEQVLKENAQSQDLNGMYTCDYIVW